MNAPATAPREIPYSDEPINEGDRWWERNITPLIARMEAKYGHLLAAPRPATPGDRPGAGGEKEEVAA